MASLNIPPNEYQVLLKIANLPEEEFNTLVNALAHLPPSLSIRRLLANAVSKLSPAKAEETNPILNTVFAIYQLKQPGRDAALELARGIVNAALASKEAALFAGGIGDTLKDRLVKLLSMDATIGMASKAIDVVSEQERSFVDARILSDMRPIFGDTLDIEASVIVHHLKIEYHENDDHKEFYVAVDDLDLEILKEAVERAQKKSASLKAMLKKTNTPYIEP